MVFSKNELCIIIDCTYNDVVLYLEQGVEINLRYLYEELFDTAKGYYMFSKWSVEGTAFLNKLKNMNNITERNLVYSIKKYWLSYIKEGIEFELDDWARSELKYINLK